jgi:hypothetical protein
MTTLQRTVDPFALTGAVFELLPFNPGLVEYYLA